MRVCQCDMSLQIARHELVMHPTDRRDTPPTAIRAYARSTRCAATPHRLHTRAMVMADGIHGGSRQRPKESPHHVAASSPRSSCRRPRDRRRDHRHHRLPGRPQHRGHHDRHRRRHRRHPGRRPAYGYGYGFGWRPRLRVLRLPVHAVLPVHRVRADPGASSGGGGIAAAAGAPAGIPAGSAIALRVRGSTARSRTGIARPTTRNPAQATRRRATRPRPCRPSSSPPAG